MKKLILTAFLAFSLTTLTNAQELDQTEAIKEQLSDAQVTQLTEAEEQIAKAEASLEKCAKKQAEADKLKSQAAGLAKGKAKKLLKQAESIETPLIAQKISAYNSYEKANSTIYGIYAANIADFASSASDKKREAAQSLTQEATNSWSAAAATLKKVPKDKKADQKKVAKLKEEASRQQKEAISQQIQTYAVLLGWFDQPSETTDRLDSEPDYSSFDEAPVAVESTERIIFKVQIAADLVPLSLKKLREIYPQKEIINNEEDNGIYRYSVGYYNTYEEAAEAIKKMGVKGAFVVAYRNGKRVPQINEVVPKE